jgi:hypothetical protein
MISGEFWFHAEPKDEETLTAKSLKPLPPDTDL